MHTKISGKQFQLLAAEVAKIVQPLHINRSMILKAAVFYRCVHIFCTSKTQFHSQFFSSSNFWVAHQNSAFISVHLSLADLLKLLDLIRLIHVNWWVFSAFSAQSSAEVFSASISVYKHLFYILSKLRVSVLCHYIPFSSSLPGSANTSA